MLPAAENRCMEYSTKKRQAEPCCGRRILSRGQATLCNANWNQAVEIVSPSWLLKGYSKKTAASFTEKEEPFPNEIFCRNEFPQSDSSNFLACVSIFRCDGVVGAFYGLSACRHRRPRITCKIICTCRVKMCVICNACIWRERQEANTFHSHALLRLQVATSVCLLIV